MRAGWPRRSTSLFPFVLCVGSGAVTFTMVKRLNSAIHRVLLILVAGLLVLLGALFIIPVVNAAVIGLLWFLLKVFSIIYLMIWFRGTFPRYRYDQLMNIGWKVAIPVGMAAVLINAVIGVKG
jgi:NADH-quinone oxidoreductase subunit H